MSSALEPRQACPRRAVDDIQFVFGTVMVGEHSIDLTDEQPFFHSIARSAIVGSEIFLFFIRTAPQTTQMDVAIRFSVTQTWRSRLAQGAPILELGLTLFVTDLRNGNIVVAKQTKVGRVSLPPDATTAKAIVQVPALQSKLLEAFDHLMSMCATDEHCNLLMPWSCACLTAGFDAGHPLLTMAAGAANGIHVGDVFSIYSHENQRWLADGWVKKTPVTDRSILSPFHVSDVIHWNEISAGDQILIKYIES